MGVESNYQSQLKFTTDSIKKDVKDVLIIGGGDSVFIHKEALNNFILSNSNLIIILTTTKHCETLDLSKHTKILCLGGNKIDASYLEKFVESIDLICTPSSIYSASSEFSHLEIDVLEMPRSILFEGLDSPLAIAFDICVLKNAARVFIAGFDGYSANGPLKHKNLMDENQLILDLYQREKVPPRFLLKSSYKNVEYSSIYASLS